MSPSSKLGSLLIGLLLLVGVVVSACQPADELLSQIKKRGTIRISTDLNYAPQSSAVQGAPRAANTKCGPDEYTANQVEGFDIDTAVAIAKRLGVEPCFVAAQWETIVAGNWSDGWDISVGSMSITRQREELLWFTPAYYYTLAQLAARRGSGIQSVADVAGRAVCVGASTTYELYLSGKDVGIPPSDIHVPAPKDVQVVALPTDTDCTQAIQDGRAEFDAVVTASNVVDKAIADGVNIEKIGGPIFVENLAVAVDKRAPKDPRSLLSAIGKIIADMHADGTLKSSSMKWFGIDRTVAP